MQEKKSVSSLEELLASLGYEPEADAAGHSEAAAEAGASFASGSMAAISSSAASGASQFSSAAASAGADGSLLHGLHAAGEAGRVCGGDAAAADFAGFGVDADAARARDAALAAIEAARGDALRSIREASQAAEGRVRLSAEEAGAASVRAVTAARTEAEEGIRGLHAKGARMLGEANQLIAASVAEARDEAVGRVRVAAIDSEAAVRSANDGLEERLREARERMDLLVAQHSEEAARAALEQAEALVEKRSEEAMLGVLAAAARAEGQVRAAGEQSAAAVRDAGEESSVAVRATGEALAASLADERAQAMLDIQGTLEGLRRSLDSALSDVAAARSQRGCSQPSEAADSDAPAAEGEGAAVAAASASDAVRGSFPASAGTTLGDESLIEPAMAVRASSPVPHAVVAEDDAASGVSPSATPEPEPAVSLGLIPSEGLPPALGGEAASTPGGSSACDFGGREARERHSRRLKGLLVGGCAAVALCCAVGLGTAVLSDSFPAILQTSAQAEEPSQGDATASADGLLAEGAAKRATYTYRLEGEAGDVSMTETVTSGVDGLCRDTVMEGEFPSAEEAQAFLDSVSASYGSACSQADIEGSRARVAIDVSSLGLTQDEYEDALRASAKDLQATK